MTRHDTIPVYSIGPEHFNAREALNEAWEIIEPAWHGVPSYTPRLPEALGLLESITSDEPTSESLSGEYVRARTVLASFGIFKAWAEDREVTGNTLLSVQQKLGAILTDVTNNTYDLWGINRGASNNLKIIMAMMLFARTQDTAHIAFPSPPLTNVRYYDEQQRNIYRNIYVTTPQDLLVPARVVERTDSPHILKMAGALNIGIGELIYTTAKGVSVLRMMPAENGLRNDRRAYHAYTAEALAAEAAGIPLQLEAEELLDQLSEKILRLVDNYTLEQDGPV